ncbi:hypothetical protein KFE94_07140 [bacterium SCSIO 12643]|nr:hypothetical protein KFE94_07140 [bacterium SCSIO 12643]
MKKWSYFIVLCGITLISGCTHDSVFEPESNTIITLKWNQAYASETKENVMLGLNWALGSIGAASKLAVSLDQNRRFQLDLDDLGFSVNAKNQIKKLHESLKQSEEYQQTGGIDLGRYVTLILGASEHYYAITGVPKRLSDVMANYQLEMRKGYVNNSVVSNKHRIISFSKQVGLRQLFLSAEIDSINEQVLEFETVEIMENGHLRFGVYGADSIRINASDPGFSEAGKPAKCMWCHEGRISPLFSSQKDKAGFLSYLQLKDTLEWFSSNLTQKQLQINGGVDFGKKQDHTQMELLYISFMYPSAARLSEEWRMPLSVVESKLSGLSTTTYAEFPFLGDVYRRSEVNSFSPYEVLSVSTSVREYSVEEVNHIN